MTLLPMVDRELRVTARQPSTYWMRVLAALLAVLISGGVLTIASLQRGLLFSQVGLILFTILKWLAFVAVSLAGVFLTADALSEEKRRGTLGLLFLTDLRGYDIVLGKLMATSLRMVYGVLAVFPVMALAFLLGGVSGREFWRVLLVLCNTLFFSLSLGLWVSAVSRHSERALSGTLFLGMGCFILPWIVDGLMAAWHRTPVVPVCVWVSPSFSFVKSGALGSSEFWLSVGLTHALSWGCVGLASVWLPKHWQERPVPQTARNRRRPASPQSSAKRVRQRAVLLVGNPVGWLVGRDRWLAWGLRSLVYGAVAVLFPLLWLADGEPWAFSTGQGILGLVLLVFFLWFASQASRFFVEARQNGMLELLLATPLTTRQIVGGHWRQLLGLFLLPTLLAVGLQTLLGVLTIAGSKSGVISPGQPFPNDLLAGQVFSIVSNLVHFATGVLAVGWFGMWMGLTSRSTRLALIKTVAFVQVLPGLGLGLVQGLLMVTVVMARWPMWIAPLVNTGLGVTVNLTFAWAARRCVLARFREYAAQPEGVAWKAPSAVSVPPPILGSGRS